jgi:hypothetical protein
MTDMRDKIAKVSEEIMFRRLVQEKLVGYTLKTSEEIADAILAALPDHVRWAADQWQREVANRPMLNVHRRALDDTWRQVIRHHGGDDVFLCGPTHDDLVAAFTGETQ